MGASACGDSDDGDDQAARTGETASSPSDRDALPQPSESPLELGSEEKVVQQVAEGMYRDLANGDAAGVCSAMLMKAREQIAQNVLGGSTVPPEERTCEDSLSKFLDAASQSGVLQQTLKADVEGVDIDGGIAQVQVSFGADAGEIKLVKEDGEWRFGPYAATPNLDN
jgi:hypothetical protein